MRHHLALYSACTPCASEWLPYAEEWAPGRWTGIAHASHAPELVAIGWVLSGNSGEPPDCACPHYRQEHWEGGHNGCCGMDGN